MAKRFTTPAAATAAGLLAPLFWGMNVSLTREISQGFGRSLGFVLLYSCSAAILFLIIGLPDFRKMKPAFRWLGPGAASLRAISFSFAVLLASTSEQTLEAGMVNFLWPSLTILFAVLFAGVRARCWLYPGIAIACCGLVFILSGDAGFSLAGFWSRASENPLCYLLALVSALSFSSYSCMARLWAGGENPSTVVYMIDAAAFALVWAFGIDPAGGSASYSLHGTASLLIGAVTMGCAHALWVHGFQFGRPAVLAAASYFTPVLSCLFGCFWMGARLSPNFWLGVALIVAGSITCASAASPRFNHTKEGGSPP